MPLLESRRRRGQERCGQGPGSWLLWDMGTLAKGQLWVSLGVFGGLLLKARNQVLRTQPCQALLSQGVPAGSPQTPAPSQ